MANTPAPSTLGDEVVLLRGALLPDVVPPVASPTAARRSATAAVATAVGTTGAAVASSAAATSTLAVTNAAATALDSPATAATTSSRTTPAAASAREERLLGRPRRLLPFGKGEVQRADHTDDLGPVAILHRLQCPFDMIIFIRHRANKRA